MTITQHTARSLMLINANANAALAGVLEHGLPREDLGFAIIAISNYCVYTYMCMYIYIYIHK